MGNPTIRLFIRRELRAVTVGLATAIGFGAGVPAALAAGPSGGAVTSGTGSILHPSSSTTLIQQLSNQLTLTWKSFNVGAGDTVQFAQPSASSVAINEILDANPSQIFGKIDANGRIVLLNPNGILFGRSAELNVGSLIASSLEMTGFDSATGHFSFRALNGAPGAVINDGTIRATNGGSVALLGGTVLNSGLVVADYGTVAMAAGKVATLDFYGGGLLRLQVSGDLHSNPTNASAAVQNAGRIEANGGQVLLTARATQAVFASAVNNSGIVRASHIDRIGGTIVLSGPDGAVSNSGTLDASGRGASSIGGTVEVLGKTVSLDGHSVIDANGGAGGGSVYVGGGAHGANPGLEDSAATHIGAGATINANALDNGNGGQVTVWSNGSTQFLGHISARGSGQGSGGSAEVSGRQTLQFQGGVDLRAPAGRVGTLLLDPATISIVHGANGSGTSSTVTDGTLSTELSTAQVSLSSSSGDITISNADGTVAIQPATQSASALSLNSAANITWNSSWSYTNNGALVLNAPHGAISPSASGEVLTLGGSPSLVMQAQSGIGSLAAPIDTVGLSSLAASDSSATNGVYVSDSGTGDTVTVSSLTPPGGTTVSGITTTGSEVSLNNSGGAIALQDEVATQGGAVALTSSGAISESGTAGKIVTSGTLTTSSSGGTVLGGANAIGGFNATNGTSGDISLVNTGALTVSGINQTGNAITVQTTGTLNTSGSVLTNSSSPVQLQAGGTLTVAAPVTAPSSSGSIALVSSGGDLALNDNVSAGTVVLSAAGGTLTQASGKTVTASALGIEASADPTLTVSPVLTLAADITGASNPFAYSQSGAFDVGTVGSVSGITTNGGSISLDSTGGTLGLGTASLVGSGVTLQGVGITQSSGGVVNAGAGDLLVNGGGGAISMAGALQTSSNGASAALIRNATTVALPAISTGTSGTTTIGAGDISAAVTQSGTTLISTGTLSGNTTGTVDLGNANAIGSLGSFSSTSLTLNDTQPLSLTAALATGSGPVNLTSSGSISEAGGAISTTGTLTTSSSGGTVLGGANAIGGFNATNGTSGDISLVNTGALTVSGINQTGNAITVQTTGTLNTSGSVLTNSSSPVQLQAGGTLTVAAPVTAPSSSGSIALVSSGGDLALNDNVSAGTVVLSAAGGTLTQASGKTVTASALGIEASADPTLTVSPVLTLAADITGASNPFAYSQSGAFDVGTVGSVSGITTNGGSISLDSTGGTLGLGTASLVGSGVTLQGVGITQSSGGVVNAGAGDLLVNGGGGAISMAGALQTSSNGASAALIRNATTVALPAISTGTSGTTTIGAGDISAAVTQSGTTLISTGTLSGNTTGTVDLGNANAIGSLGSFSSTSLTLNDTQPLSLTAALATGSGPVNLTSSGSISEAGGQIGTTGTLTTVSTGGTLLEGNNTVSAFNASNSGSGALKLTDGAPLNVTGIQQSGGGSVSIANAGGTTVSGPINAGTGSVSLADSSGLLTLGGSSVSGNGIVLQGNGVTQSSASVVNAGSGAISVAGGSGAVNLAGAMQTSSNSATAVVIQSSNAVTLPGISTGSGGTTTIDSGGVLTQSGTTAISTGTLTASTTSGSVSLGNANSIAALGPVTSSGLTVNDSVPMNIVGLLNVGASGVELTTSGAMTEVGSGSITTSGATTLTANNGGDVNLAGANAFGGSVAFAGHNVTLNASTGSLSSAGSASGALEETAVGGITQSGILDVAGPVTLNALSGSDIALGNYGNTFGGPLSFNGNNVIIEAGPGGLSAAGTATGNLTLGAKGAAADLTIGKMTAGGDVLLIAGDNILGTGPGATVNANNIEIRYGIENPKAQLSSANAGQQFGLASTSGTTVAVTVWSPAGPARPTQQVRAPTGSVLNVTDHAFLPNNPSLESALYNDPFGTSVSQIALGSLGSITSANFSQFSQGEANAGSESISGSEHVHLVYIDWASYNPNVTLFGTLNPAVCLPADQRIAGTGSSSACRAPASVAFTALLPRGLLATAEGAPAWSGLWAK
jgi:filamentous hemagglutinin family protein